MVVPKQRSSPWCTCTANIYFDDICMEIGAAKGSVVAILKGHLAEANDITLIV